MHTRLGSRTLVRQSSNVTRLLALAAVVSLAAPRALAQRPDSLRAATGVRVSGVVRDTIARTPLVGALVQLASSDGAPTSARSVRSDSVGRFVIDAVPAGRYMIGFFHPLLDSLGVQAPVVDLRVAQRPVRVDLSTPSASLLRASFCGAERTSGAGSGALLLGVVRDARDGEPIAGASVRSEWVEFTLSQGRLTRQEPSVVTTSGEQGAFALCGIPRAGTILLRATGAADSTDLVELRSDSDGLLRRDLYLGAAPTLLRGTVSSSDGSRPLAGATVRMLGGGEARANARGEWTLAAASAGTRMLEVRAIGFYPQRHAVDVVAGAPPLFLSLLTFQEVLDTVRVVVSRVNDRSEGGFDRRRRTSLGNFFTEADLARRGAIVTSDIFRSMPGARFEGSGFNRQIMLRGAFGDDCPPSLFVDGVYLFEPSADELDVFVRPNMIGGIEVYTGANAPPQFQRSSTLCGAIVVWTKGRLPRVPGRRR